MTNLERLIVRAQFSEELTEAELKNFVSFFLWADDQDLAVVVEAIRKQPSFLRVLHQNLEAKRRAAQTQDPEAWDQILKDEISQLDA